MAEEFQAAICGGTTATTWWNPSRTVLSPCSVAEFGFNLMNDHHHNQMGSYGWSTSNDDHIVDPKSTTSINNSNIVSRSSNCDQESNNSVISGDSSVIFQNQKTTDSDSGGSSSIFMDSTFNMMGFGLPSSSTSSSPTDWNHALLHENVRGGEDNNYGSMIQEDMINNHDSSSSTVHNISQGLYGYPSTLLQAGLFEPNQTQQQQQSCLFNNRSINNYLSTVNNYRPNSNDVVLSTASWTKPTASFQKQQPSSLQFNNNTPFWNASTTGFLPNSSPSQLISPTVGNNKPNSFSTLTTKCNNNHEEVRDSGSVVKKGSSEPAFKRPRIETPSPLPTFKVRKEKLGDRITALQQLVSPFGKTDTASVLHEAIEYIKYLHDQVSVLSTPYMKPGNPIQQQQGAEKLMKDAETPKQDLRSRGLCLVPISSTFPVANVTTPDFWTPTFGGSYR